MKNYLIFTLLFFIISPLKSFTQVVLDPPCAGTANYLGRGIGIVCSPDSPCDNLSLYYEICLDTINYASGVGNCLYGDWACGVSRSGPNCIFKGYSCGGVFCNDCETQNCTGPCNISQIDISDTIIVANKHKIRFFQQNWFQGQILYQGMIDLEQRCLNKNFGVKCKVSVDGASSTIIDVIGPNPSSIGIRPATSPLDSNFNGYLNKYFVQPNVEAYAYFSPNGQISVSDSILTYEIFDVNCPNWVLATFRIRKHKVPVLLVHGLNSNGTTWDGFRSILIQSGYSDSIISTPNLPNDQSFSSTYPLLNQIIQSLLSKYRSQSININQVDIIGHSMGGILGRYHLQSTEYANMWNINKLITVNTPHFGSEWANIALNTQYFPYISWINNNTLGINLNGGAIDDLRVNSSAITYLNSTQQLVNSKRAPIHTVTSDWTFCENSPSIGTLEKFIFQASWYYRFSKFTCWNLCPFDCVLGVQNDGVVGHLSQKGGLNGTSSNNFVGFHPKNGHVGVLGLNNEDVYNHLLSVLNSSTKSSYFTISGFNYQPLPPPSLQPDSEGIESRSVVDVEISNLQNGDTIWASLNPVIEITGTPQVEGQILLFIYNDGSFVFDSSFQSSHIYNIPIPIGYTGRIDIGVLGTDGTGNIDFESVYLYFSQTALPLQWKTFDAKESNGRVHLFWEVEEVINVTKFVIEYSKNGYQFIQLSEVEAIGNINSPTSYTYIHHQPVKGENYYRVKYINYDGTYSYSRINIVKLEQGNSINLSPNPTDDKIQIVGDIDLQAGSIYVKIYDYLGRCIGNPILKDDLSISMKDYHTGIYSVSINLDNVIHTFRILKK